MEGDTDITADSSNKNIRYLVANDQTLQNRTLLINNKPGFP